MSNKHQYIFALALIAALTGVGCAVAKDEDTTKGPRSGVSGRVSVSPSCPGPQKIDQGTCASPLTDAMLTLKKENAALLLKTRTAADGSYAFQAPAGHYVLKVEIEGMYPRCPDVDVSVAKGHMVKADIACDSGMR
ncbi:MAG: carboxypeptidase-like regulatory domain-containing protein [Rhodoferax sp.]|nr:carboxypeptidase-like regulatory domain-containing protein [Rhodoferax sp.]